MASPPCSKEHFNAYNYKNRAHGYEAWHGRVAVVPEMGETWVRERLKGRREQVDKGSRNEDTCAKVPGYEEELVRYGYRGKALDNDGEGASCARGQQCSGRQWQAVAGSGRQWQAVEGKARTSSTQDEDENQGKDVNESVVLAFAALGLALWPLSILLLSSQQLGVEDVRREFGEVCKRNIVSM